MPDHAEHPKFIDVLCAAVLTLWAIVFAGLFIFVLFVEHETFFAALATSFILLIFMTILAFILGGIVSLPLWLMFKYLNRLNLTIAGVGGALTGALISLPIIMMSPSMFSGNPIKMSNTNLATFLCMALLGGIAGWNGYRVAWNGRRRKALRT